MKRNLWPYGIMTAFAVFISGTIALILMASAQKEDLVNRSYYEQELRYQSRLDNLARAAQCGASVAYDAKEQSIALSLPLSRPGASPTGSVQLYRPSAAG